MTIRPPQPKPYRSHASKQPGLLTAIVLVTSIAPVAQAANLETPGPDDGQAQRLRDGYERRPTRPSCGSRRKAQKPSYP